jgi:transcriptional regulator with XRE-family HTH domain
MAAQEALVDATVGRRIHHLMWDRKMTQTRLASALGLTQPGLSKKIRGDRGWSLEDLLRAARALRVTPAELLEGIELPDLDSNQEPAGIKPGRWLSTVERSADHTAEVIELRPRKVAPRVVEPRLA